MPAAAQSRTKSGLEENLQPDSFHTVEVIHPERLEKVDLQGIIFDFDDTLWTGFPRDLEARLWAQWAFSKENPSAEEIETSRYFLAVSSAGEAGEERLNRWRREIGPLPEDTSESSGRIRARLYEASLPRLTRDFIVPGAPEFLAALRAADIRLAIASGGSKELRTEYAGKLGILRFFSQVYGDGNKAAAVGELMKRWNLTSRQMAMIGDGGPDMAAAKANGILAIGFAPTPEYRRRLIDAGADVVLHGDYRDLGAIQRLLRLSERKAGLEENPRVLRRWEEVLADLERIQDVPLQEAYPVIVHLVANLWFSDIQADTRVGETIGDLSRRIASATGRLLARVEKQTDMWRLRPLLKALPRVDVDSLRNDLDEAWGITEELDERYLADGVSSELRKRIHGHFSRRDVEFVKGYLRFLETGEKDDNAPPGFQVHFYIRDKDEEVARALGKQEPWAQEIYQLVKELEERLERVIHHTPSDLVDSYEGLSSFRKETAQDLRLFEEALSAGDVLQAVLISDQIRQALGGEFFSTSDPASRLRLSNLDEDIERLVYVHLADLYEKWQEDPVGSLPAVAEVLSILVDQMGRYGLLSLGLVELFQRAGPGRSLLTVSQARDLARLFSEERGQVAFVIASLYKPVALAVAAGDEVWANQFIGGMLRRSEFDFHWATALAEFIEETATRTLEKREDKLLFPEERAALLPMQALHFSEMTLEDVRNVKDGRALYGGKGMALAHMAALGLPVPEGFVIPSTLRWLALDRKGDFRGFRAQLSDDVRKELRRLEETIARREGRPLRFGDPQGPLLLSVRSGSALSMPGMMNSVTNVGMNDEIAQALVDETKDPWFVYDSYRRFLRDYATTVWGMDPERFVPIIDHFKRRDHVNFKEELRPSVMAEVVGAYKGLIRRSGFGKELDQLLADPQEALVRAIESVFASWDSEPVRQYRLENEISEKWGTAVTVQRMAFGNRINRTHDRTKDSLTGVAYSRDLQTGTMLMTGEFKRSAQGNDLVAGEVESTSIRSIERDLPADYPDLWKRLTHIAAMLDAYFRAPQDIEFTVDAGTLELLQSRNADLEIHRYPRLETRGRRAFARGIGASGGAYRGLVGFLTSDLAALRKKVDEINQHAGAKDVDGILLLVSAPNNVDLQRMLDQGGWLVERGGRTSHAALLARHNGITAVVGVAELEVDESSRRARFMAAGGRVFKTVSEGDILSVDGHVNSGRVFAGSLPLAENGRLPGQAGLEESGQRIPFAEDLGRLQGKEWWNAMSRSRREAIARFFGDAGRRISIPADHNNIDGHYKSKGKGFTVEQAQLAIFNSMAGYVDSFLIHPESMLGRIDDRTNQFVSLKEIKEGRQGDYGPLRLHPGLPQGKVYVVKWEGDDTPNGDPKKGPSAAIGNRPTSQGEGLGITLAEIAAIPQIVGVKFMTYVDSSLPNSFAAIVPEIKKQALAAHAAGLLFFPEDLPAKTINGEPLPQDTRERALWEADNALHFAQALFAYGVDQDAHKFTFPGTFGVMSEKEIADNLEHMAKYTRRLVMLLSGGGKETARAAELAARHGLPIVGYFPGRGVWGPSFWNHQTLDEVKADLREGGTRERFDELNRVMADSMKPWWEIIGYSSAQEAISAPVGLEEKEAVQELSLAELQKIPASLATAGIVIASRWDQERRLWDDTPLALAALLARIQNPRDPDGYLFAVVARTEEHRRQLQGLGVPDQVIVQGWDKKIEETTSPAARACYERAMASAQLLVQVYYGVTEVRPVRFLSENLLQLQELLSAVHALAQAGVWDLEAVYEAVRSESARFA